jgi:hypothetical protein
LVCPLVMYAMYQGLIVPGCRCSFVGVTVSVCMFGPTSPRVGDFAICVWGGVLMSRI